MSKTVQKKKKLNWILWLIIFILFMIAGYLVSGIFEFEDLNISNYGEKLEYVFTHPFENHINDKTKYVMFITLTIYLLCFSYALSNLKNYMPGKEMGSAEWGDPKEFNKALEDSKGDNMVLSKNLRKAYDTKYTMLNNNITCVGGSGAGKTTSFVGPNLLQFHGSTINTDPKGDTLADFGEALKQEGKRVRVINLINMLESHRYNPFKYISRMADLRRLITNIIANTTPAEANKGDPFWDKAETLYLTALFAYVWLECDNVPYYKYAVATSLGQIGEDLLPGCIEHEQVTERIWRGKAVDEDGKVMYLKKTMRTLLILLDEAAVSDEGIPSELDCRLEDLKNILIAEGKNPDNHPAIKNYNRAIRGAGDTIRSIIISANARFAPFDDPDLLNIFDGDDIDLPSIGIGINGDEKTSTALFCVIPDDDQTYNFVPGMLYTQLFQELYRVARNYRGRCPIDVGCWFDEFANIKMPNDFEKILATCRSRNIYIVIILQSLAQLKSIFKDNYEGITGNTDTIVYLGGNETSTHKYFSEMLGKWTIDKRTTGQTFGAHGSTSRNEDILGRELMTPEEIREMPNQDCLVFVRGQKPIYDRKMYWFKERKWDYIKEYDSYRFVKLMDKPFELLDSKAKQYLKNTKNVQEYDFNSLLGFLSIDFSEGKRKSEEEIKKQIELINRGEMEISNDNDNAVDDINASEEVKIEDIIINNNLNEEQIEALTDAIIQGVPEDKVKEIAKKAPSAQRIKLISELYADKSEEVV